MVLLVRSHCFGKYEMNVCPQFYAIDAAEAHKFELGSSDLGIHLVGETQFRAILEKELAWRNEEVKITGPVAVHLRVRDTPLKEDARASRPVRGRQRGRFRIGCYAINARSSDRPGTSS